VLYEKVYSGLECFGKMKKALGVNGDAQKGGWDDLTTLFLNQMNGNVTRIKYLEEKIPIIVNRRKSTVQELEERNRSLDEILTDAEKKRIAMQQISIGVTKPTTP
jgi:hypothetical protein